MINKFLMVFMLFALILSLSVSPAAADGPIAGPNDQLCWDRNTESDLSGYGLHIATTPQVGATTKTYPVFKDVLLTPTPAAPCVKLGDLNLTEGQKYAAATAVDTAKNRSGFSNEVAFVFDKTSPSNPGGLIITIVIPNAGGASVSVQSTP